MADEPSGPLYHLAVESEWERAQAEGSYRRSTIDTSLEEEGYIHASFAHQAQGVADRYYRGRTDIVLLAIDPALVDVEVRVENTSGGTEGFPHLYGPLNLSAVTSVTPVMADVEGRLVLDGVLD